MMCSGVLKAKQFDKYCCCCREKCSLVFDQRWYMCCPHVSPSCLNKIFVKKYFSQYFQEFVVSTWLTNIFLKITGTRSSFRKIFLFFIIVINVAQESILTEYPFNAFSKIIFFPTYEMNLKVFTVVIVVT